MSQKIFQLVDSTLREGEQHPGVSFSVQEKIYFANALKNCGVDIIEIGHPGISDAEEKHCSEVISALPNIATLVHARAHEAEILAAKRTGAQWVGIWIAINEIAFESKFTDKNIDWVLEQVKISIGLAKKLNLFVRFTIEDASRTEWKRIQAAINVALNSGADRISFADTVGAWKPSTCAEIITLCKNTFNCPLEVHLHNDLGLAVANALAAIDAGVDAIDVSLLGLGERAGITDLLQLATAVSHFYGMDRFKLPDLVFLSHQLSQIIGFSPDPMRPLMGNHVFTHTSHYHQQAVARKPTAYENISPEKMGKKRKKHLKTVRNENINRVTIGFQVNQPQPKPASELLYHRDGPGIRWLMMDKRVDSRACLYIIQRTFNNENMDSKEVSEKYHVDTHAHHCPSVFVFWGNEENGTGLCCKVILDGEEKIVESPASVYIPAGVLHSYYYISGRGSYWNIVLAPDYNSSLLEL